MSGSFRRSHHFDGLGREDAVRGHVGVGKLERAHVVQQRAEAVDVDRGLVAHQVERPAEHARRAEADGCQLAVLAERGGDKRASRADGLPPVDQHGAVHIAGAGHRQDDIGGADVAVHHAAVARVHGVDDVQRGLEDGVRLVERARVARQHARCQRLLDGEPFDVLHGDGVMGQPLLIGAGPQREGGGRVSVGSRHIAQAFELAQRCFAVGCVVRAVAVVTVKALDGHGRAVIACCAHQLGEAAGFGVVGQDFACKAKIRESCGEFRDGEGDRACHGGHLFGSRMDGAGGRAGTGWGCPGRVERAGRMGQSGRACGARR